ncbi:MAG TPA: HlyD family secretion protein [Verrucomicrobiae bacterium]|jgi:membrane fusion protein (multidrug efflux system)|nr:HlyD family secretion protein [Verrucomicrobiae bacterium]
MDESQPQGATPPKTNGGENAPAKNAGRSIWKRPPVVILGTIVLALILIWSLAEVAKSFSHESTDDAFLAADIVSISPKISGEVKQVFVKDNQTVKAGDPLVEIDPRDYATALAEKKAALAAANANTNVIASSFQMLGVQITTAEATAQQSAAQAAADQATAEKAASDQKRAQDLFERKIIAPQEFDSAKAIADAATNTLKASEAKAASDRSKIDEARAEFEAGRSAYYRALAQATQADVDVSQADLSLSYAHIVAPADGRITRKAVEPGDYVQVGQRLMAVVPTNIWIVANFKETQLTKIRTNQPVEISVDAIHGRTFTGHVESIQAGSGAAFSLLPPENAVGNYVKVVQRVPVKIVFDDPLDAGHVLGPGMSAVPSVQVGAPVSKAVVIVIAILVALGIGVFWWRAATKRPAA